VALYANILIFSETFGLGKMIGYMVNIEHASYILVQGIFLVLYYQEKFSQSLLARYLKDIEHQTFERIWALICREKQSIWELLML
jgi:hypothetical protein